MRIGILLYFILLFFKPMLKGNNVYDLKPGKQPERISNRFYYFEDKNHEVDIDKVVEQGEFKPVLAEVPNFNITESTIWAKLNLTTQYDASWYLAVEPSSYSQLTLYQRLKNGKWKETTLGSTITDSERDIPISHFLFKLNMQAGDTCLLLLKARDYFPIMLDIRVAPLETMVVAYNRIDMYNSICFGIMIMMAIYNLYLFISNKGMAYLYYVLYVMFNILFTSLLAGYAFYLPRQLVAVLFNIPIIPPAGFGIFGLLFTLQFFKEALSPAFKKAIYIFICIAVANIILSAGPYKHLSEIIIQPLGLILGVFSISAAIIALRKKHSSAKYYLIGFGAYMLSLFYLIFAALGIIPIQTSTWGVLITGSVIECIMLSFALGDKFKFAQKEKERAQLETIMQAMENERLIKEQNSILEQKVKERTIELQEEKEKVEFQKDLIEQKQKEILDSIRYARNIQIALLPPERQIEKILRRMSPKK